MTLSWYADGLLVSAYFGLKQLAVLSVALLMPEQIKIWSKELFPILYATQASGADSVERRKKITQLVGMGTAVAGAGILVYCLITPFIVPFLFPKYNPGEITFLTNVAAATLISTPATLYTQYLEARGMIRELQWCNWTSSVFYVVALVVLVPMYGPLGAILSRGILRAAFAGVGYIALKVVPIKN
jgi:O-antigen/teichoic acid export membrane protein